jgi:uroporphyrinogen-III synthase
MYESARRRAAHGHDRLPRAEARRGTAQAWHPGTRQRAFTAHDGELLEVLPPDLVAAQSVVLLHDGGGNPALVEALRERGARVLEIRSYEWRLPADVEPIEILIAELVEGRLDAIAFTNQVQVRHLFQIGARTGQTAALRYALRHRTIVASIGPTCSLALDEHGVPPHTVASPPKMRPLVAAIGEQLAARRGHTTADSTS